MAMNSLLIMLFAIVIMLMGLDLTLYKIVKVLMQIRDILKEWK